MNIIHLVSNKVWGGGERYVLDLCRYMSAQGHSVAVVSRGIGAVDAPFRAAGSRRAGCHWADCSIL